MSAFRKALRELNPDAGSNRTWVYVPYDQLTDAAGPLSQIPAERAGIVLIENRWKAARRPYHRQKLGLVLANMRNFALEQAKRGVRVHYVHGDAPYRELVRGCVEELGPLRMAQAAEWELRADLAPLVEEGGITVERNDAFLTEDEDFDEARHGDDRFRMDAFYRHVRRKLDILMDDDKPVGGKWSFDAENRESWSGDPPAPELPRFDMDDVRKEVAELIEETFDHHPGALDLQAVPTSAPEHQAWLDWVCEQCMHDFGPYEDAMSLKDTNLFHSRLSASINLGRILPSTVVDRMLDLDIPLASKEGFIRQIIGWREFMRHVHQRTEGFRTVADVREGLGEGGWSGLSRGDWSEPAVLDGETQADPKELDADLDVPPAFWGVESGLLCLDHVVETVWAEGYSHHITRLMILSNLATLLGVSPRSLADWFWVAYVDAYDWVVEPNVLGMGTFGLGDLFTTKPYVSGSAYINRMSDYCGDCQFHPKKNCPITSMYWSFLEHNKASLDGNPRVAMPLRSLERRGDEKRETDRRVRLHVIQRLRAGERLDLDSLADA